VEAAKAAVETVMLAAAGPEERRIACAGAGFRAAAALVETCTAGADET